MNAHKFNLRDFTSTAAAQKPVPKSSVGKVKLVDFTSTSAAKKPSPKALQKAAATLKAHGKAKADGIKTKLQDLINQAMQISNDHSAERKVSDAQKQKLQGQIDKIEKKQDAAMSKADAKIAKLAPRIDKLQDQYLAAGGKEIIPSELKTYLDRPVESGPVRADDEEQDETVEDLVKNHVGFKDTKPTKAMKKKIKKAKKRPTASA